MNAVRSSGKSASIKSYGALILVGSAGNAKSRIWEEERRRGALRPNHGDGRRHPEIIPGATQSNRKGAVLAIGADSRFGLRRIPRRHARPLTASVAGRSREGTVDVDA